MLVDKPESEPVDVLPNKRLYTYPRRVLAFKAQDIARLRSFRDCKPCECAARFAARIARALHDRLHSKPDFGHGIGVRGSRCCTSKQICCCLIRRQAATSTVVSMPGLPAPSAKRNTAVCSSWILGLDALAPTFDDPTGASKAIRYAVFHP